MYKENNEEAERISRVKDKSREIINENNLKMKVVDVEDDYYVMSVENVKVSFYPSSDRLSPADLSNLLVEDGIFDCYSTKSGKFIILVDYKNFLD